MIPPFTHSLANNNNNIPCLTGQQVDDMQLKEPILTPPLSFSLDLCPFFGFLHKPPSHHHARTPQLSSSSICPLPYKVKNKRRKEQHDNNHGTPIIVASKKPDLAHNNWLLLLYI
jgi:hypothetical protein